MNRVRRYRTAHLLAALGLLLCALWLVLHAQSASVAQASPGAQITPRLQAMLVQAADSGAPIEFVAVLDSQVDSAAVAAEVAAAGDATSVHAKGAAIYHALVAKAQRTQVPLRAWLDAQGVSYRAYYIRNMLLIRGDAALVETLASRDEIALLAANEASVLLEPDVPQSELTGDGVEKAGASLPWGLDFIQAPAVWAEGFTGEGIVVASQDTGVQWDHPALKAKYRGWNAATESVDHVYNWFDAWGLDAARASQCSGDAATDPQIPCDDNGHGTHTVGTMVGDATEDGGTVLGVAPDAKWIGCRNMTAGVGTPTSYADCFQFFLAPYPQGGDPMTDGDPEKAPNIINNSWGCPQREGCDDPNILRSVVETARAAGEFVVSSAGNSGSAGCGTVNQPIGIYDAVFSIGALDSSGTLASFSSRGPVTVDGSNRLKPDLSAPGTGVYSSYAGGGYASLSGTSMASPHVAGAVALLWSAAPELIGDIDRTEQILRESATPVEYTTCGGSLAAGGVPTNNGYGAGQLNVLAAVQLALNGAPSLAVTVIDADGKTLPNVEVEVVNLTTSATYTATTSSAGVALFGAIATRDWQGMRTLYYLHDQKTHPLIYIDAPHPIFVPLLFCSRADCHTVTDIRTLADSPTVTPTATPTPTPTVTDTRPFAANPQN